MKIKEKEVQNRDKMRTLTRVSRVPMLMDEIINQTSKDGKRLRNLIMSNPKSKRRKVGLSKYSEIIKNGLKNRFRLYISRGFQKGYEVADKALI